MENRPFFIGDHLNWTMIVYKCIHTIGYIFIGDIFYKTMSDI
jgi:hypothetical protein